MRHSIHEAFFEKTRFESAPFLDIFFLFVSFSSFFFFSPLCFLIFALAFVRIFLDYEIYFYQLFAFLMKNG